MHASWDVYFSGLDKGLTSAQAFQPPPRHLPAPADGAPALYAAGSGAELDDHLKVCRWFFKVFSSSSIERLFSRFNYLFVHIKCADTI